MADPVITIPSFATAQDGVRHFFGTKHARLEVTPGRAIVSPRPGSGSREPSAWISVKQVHGTDVLVVDRPVRASEQFDGEWDALITDQPGIAVTVRTADCVPVLLHDPGRRVVAAIHAGWRGAVAGIVPKTIRQLRERFGCDAASVRMAIGPSAGSCCYEVDEPVLARLREALTDPEPVIRRRTGPGKALVDLRELVRRQAVSVGLPEAGIVAVNVCTICHPQLFFSYRREGVVKQTMVSGIALLPPR